MPKPMTEQTFEKRLHRMQERQYHRKQQIGRAKTYLDALDRGIVAGEPPARLRSYVTMANHFLGLATLPIDKNAQEVPAQEAVAT